MGYTKPPRKLAWSNQCNTNDHVCLVPKSKRNTPIDQLIDLHPKQSAEDILKSSLNFPHAYYEANKRKNTWNISQHTLYGNIITTQYETPIKGDRESAKKELICMAYRDEASIKHGENKASLVYTDCRAKNGLPK